MPPEAASNIVRLAASCRDPEPTRHGFGAAAVVGVLASSPTLRRRWLRVSLGLILLGPVIGVVVLAAGPSGQRPAALAGVLALLGGLGLVYWLLAAGAAAIARIVARDLATEGDGSDDR
jgi:hypothetical protein